MTHLKTDTGLHVVLGAGPVGRTLARTLAGQGARVRLVSRSGATETLPGNIEKIDVDLTNAEAAARAVSDAGTIYHCAAPAYEHWVRDFPVLQRCILGAAMTTNAPMVMLDNLYAYGVAGTLSEDLPLSATGPKGRLRADMARELMALHDGGKIKATIARAADFVGPGARMTALGERFWPQLLQGKTIQWFGDPDAPHSFTYLPDLADAMIRLGGSEQAMGRAWHVPSQPATPLREIASKAAMILGTSPPKVTVTPRVMMRLVGLFVPAARELIEVEYQFRNRFELDYAAYHGSFGGEPTDLDTVLAATLTWWNAELGLTSPLPHAA